MFLALTLFFKYVHHKSITNLFQTNKSETNLLAFLSAILS